MPDDLTALAERLDEMRDTLARADEAEYAALLDKLETIVVTLQANGAPVPAWAQESLDAAHAEDVEDGFDNMPI